MILKSENSGGVLVLTVEVDRIDAASAIHLKDEFREITATTQGRILMNLGAVLFMDSSGLGAMVAALKTLGGRKLELCNLTTAVDKVFTLTRMNKVFLVHSDQEQALANSGPKGANAA